MNLNSELKDKVIKIKDISMNDRFIILSYFSDTVDYDIAESINDLYDRLNSSLLDLYVINYENNIYSLAIKLEIKISLLMKKG